MEDGIFPASWSIFSSASPELRPRAASPLMFAALIASRSVHSAALQMPLPGSAVELTVKVTAAVQEDRLEVTYVIPAGQHITLQESFVFIRPKPGKRSRLLRSP
jgi:hypothetical protein